MKPIITITANIKEATTTMQRLSFSMRKLAISILMAQDSDSFNEKLKIVFWSVIGLNLICLISVLWNL